jgi:hypothetical protein
MQPKDPCPDWDHMCVRFPSLDAWRRSEFETCQTKAFVRGKMAYEKAFGGDGCGTCEPELDEATRACVKYLTPEEIQCLDKTTVGEWMGNPFHCEDGEPATGN